MGYDQSRAGNLRYRSDNLNGVFEYACYDALNRLRYDAAGNGVTSPAVLTDQTGAVVERNAYDA